MLPSKFRAETGAITRSPVTQYQCRSAAAVPAVSQPVTTSLFIYLFIYLPIY
jgi:hypothetical protein